MIPIHELQIGSWVKFDGKECLVVALDAYDTPTIDYVEGMDDLLSVDYDALEPIPLTDEWLTRQDFEHKKREGDQWYVRDIYSLYPLGATWIIYIGTPGVDAEICQIRYVHQLQLFWAAVTGEKLEVK